MAVDLKVPAWLTEKCAAWIDRLSMREWEIATGMSLAPLDDSGNEGCAEHYPDINFGRLTFRVDIEDDADGEITLVHELLHIKHSRIDDVVMKVLEPHIGDVPTEMVDSLYRRAMEPFIHSLAVALVELARGAEQGEPSTTHD